MALLTPAEMRLVIKHRALLTSLLPPCSNPSSVSLQRRRAPKKSNTPCLRLAVSQRANPRAASLILARASGLRVKQVPPTKRKQKEEGGQSRGGRGRGGVHGLEEAQGSSERNQALKTWIHYAAFIFCFVFVDMLYYHILDSWAAAPPIAVLCNVSVHRAYVTAASAREGTRRKGEKWEVHSDIDKVLLVMLICDSISWDNFCVKHPHRAFLWEGLMQGCAL